MLQETEILFFFYLALFGSKLQLKIMTHLFLHVPTQYRTIILFFFTFTIVNLKLMLDLKISQNHAIYTLVLERKIVLNLSPRKTLQGSHET